MRAQLMGAISLVLALVIPSKNTHQERPRRVDLASKYATSEYVLIEGAVYKVGSGSRTTSAVINYLSRKTDIVNKRYVFAKCGGEKILFLSPSDPSTLETLLKARFVGPDDTAHARFEKFYQEQCWSSLALADRFHRFESRFKFWNN